MQWIELLISLCGIIGLIIFVFWFLRRLQKGLRLNAGSKLKVIDRMVFGRDSMLAVVSICGKLSLFVVNPGRIEKICDLPISEEEYLLTAQEEANKAIPKALSFSEILSNISEKFNKQGKDK
ncbi:MAG: flagellar biosynthetic protein FliO [Eubacterium sp.]|jgi:flagellar biogenesis protein FliO|nr:flagellar biosynthetic protein FliO [Eubacterium sp.]